METLYQILALVGGALIVWMLYRTIKGQPNQFSREKIQKSLSTLGILGILLIGFVALLVVIVKHT